MVKAKSGKKETLKERLENHLIMLVSGAVVAAAGLTAGVCIYFSGEELKLEKGRSDLELDKTKQELGEKIRDLDEKMLSIQRHLGPGTTTSLM